MATEHIKRRLGAILAADAAGYSRLMAADEHATVAALDAARAVFRAKIESNQGRVIDMAGDSILALFETATGAVDAAIAIQDALETLAAGIAEDRQMRFRIGIHLGDVIEKADGTIYGDGVNIAARIQAIADPGGVGLSEDVHRQVRDRMKVAFADLGEQTFKNIARPIRTFAVGPRGAGAAKPAEPQSGPPRLSIVVLPFANLGGDAEQDYFVDGVTETLTTDLSRIAGSFVIGRNTAFTYKGKAVDLKQVGRELGVRYALEGSVQRGGNRMRINVQLIETETGQHLWAERFDKPVADLFDMQDEVVARLANQLGAQLVAAEARRAERAPKPDSLDLYFQGWAWVNKGLTPEYLMKARGFFERALALDPGSVENLAGIAGVDGMLGTAFMADDRDSRIQSAEAALTRILSQTPNHAWAHGMLGTVMIYTKRAVKGVAACERALALDPNLVNARAHIGIACHFAGRPAETEGHVREALRLSPRDTRAYMWMGMAGSAKHALREYPEAIDWYRRGLEANRNSPIYHFLLGATLANSGRRDEASEAVRAGLVLDPGFTIRRFLRGAPSDNAAFLEHRGRQIEGLRKAGVPEG